MTMSNRIRVSDEIYALVVRLSRKLQKVLGRPVPIDEGMSLSCKEDIMNLAGSWDLSDEETEKLKKEIEDLWSGWRKG